jgi:capsular polysaccharide biosynthesis protein
MSEHVTDCVSQDEELDLLDLMSVLLQRKKIIIGITTLIAVFVATYAFFSMVLSPETSYLPNEYTPKAEMLINDSSSAGGDCHPCYHQVAWEGLQALQA